MTGNKFAYIHTFGCQQNVSDSEKIKGILADKGYAFTDHKEWADLILFNTCAVREHAELKVFGNVGALKALKVKNPGLIIVLCGCMVQQESIAQKIKASYPFVDLVFGTNALHKLPALLDEVKTTHKRVFELSETEELIEGLPVQRDGKFKAFLPIMYGCDNFCSYCVVPLVRGRERSRRPEDILAEARELINRGYKEIMLLGQNVNSYGKHLSPPINFASLLRQINNIPGDFTLRFMTSHPKDCTHELLDTMAACKKVERHLHLPFQAGSNRVLKAMNRKYTRESYLDLIAYARQVMPDISLTSDVIVGFPGEQYQDFEQTVSLVKAVGFTSLYTFIYSPRQGTPAAKMADEIPKSQKSDWFSELLAVQEKIAGARTAKMLGQIYRVLAEEKTEKGSIRGRTSGNIMIEFDGADACIGQFVDVQVIETLTFVLKGKQID